jgi:hypothetical protein
MAYNTSVFGQILQIIPKTVFVRAVKECNAEKRTKGFSSWDQFVAMLFCQFTQSKSLREICDGLRVTCGKLNHLRLSSAPAKSTLAYANAHRPWELFQKLFFILLKDCERLSPGKKNKFRFKNPLYSLDSTVIDLCASMFEWATFRQSKGAVKLHMLLDHDGYLPSYAVITEGNVHDVTVAKQFKLPKGSIVAVDRGYCDYQLYADWDKQGVYFVTRQKSNAAYEVVKNFLPPQNSNIRADQNIRLTSAAAAKVFPGLLRRVVVWSEEHKCDIVLLTNKLDLSSTTIANIFKDRWEIELFFKVLKQHLKIKTFVGTSANALKTQIWTALITILLIKYMQFRSKCGLALCRLVSLLRLNLFTYRDLWAWLDKPFGVPPDIPSQLDLAF